MHSIIEMDAPEAVLFIFPTIWLIVSWILHFIIEMDGPDDDLFIFSDNFTES